jgi:hypothetical protein
MKIDLPCVVTNNGGSASIKYALFEAADKVDEGSMKRAVRITPVLPDMDGVQLRSISKLTGLHLSQAGKDRRMNEAADGKMGLWAVVAIGAGGMVGGGIFAVLGLAVLIEGAFRLAKREIRLHE